MPENNDYCYDDYDIIMARLRRAAEFPENLDSEDQELVEFVRSVPSYNDIYRRE